MDAEMSDGRLNVRGVPTDDVLRVAMVLVETGFDDIIMNRSLPEANSADSWRVATTLPEGPAKQTVDKVAVALDRIGRIAVSLP